MSHILVVKSAHLLPGVLVQYLGHHLKTLGLLPLGLLDLLENILPLPTDTFKTKSNMNFHNLFIKQTYF